MIKVLVHIRDDFIPKIEIMPPQSLADLENSLCEHAKVVKPFTILLWDADFSAYGNMESASEVVNCSKLKLVFQSDPANQASASHADVASTSSVSEGQGFNFRQNVWPEKFVIPEFEVEVMSLLNHALDRREIKLDLSPGQKGKLLTTLANEIYKYTAYPNGKQLDQVAEALVTKYSCLADRDSSVSWRSWKIAITYKMGNLRSKLKGASISEICVNTNRRSKTNPHLSSPNQNIKKAKRGVVNSRPDLPAGETGQTQEDLRAQIAEELARVHPSQETIRAKMNLTFASRRMFIQTMPALQEVKEKWPGLFQKSQMQAEFLRLTNVPLRSTFFEGLDDIREAVIREASKKATKAPGGFVKLLNENSDLQDRRAAALMSLPVLLGQENCPVFKDFEEDTPEGEVVHDLATPRIGIIGSLKDPVNIVITAEGIIILEDIEVLPEAFMYLIGVHYVLDLHYNKKATNTLTFLQKVVMKIEPNALPNKVYTFNQRLLKSLQ